MGYDPTDSSGTDDDLPPAHQNRVPRGGPGPGPGPGRMTGNGRSAVGSVPYPRMHTDMETQIHILEQEAYSSVLRAFKAQSNALSWEKESLITELRKELRVSDEEHRELLGRVNADDTVCRIREWRQAGGGHMPGMHNTAQPVHDPAPSPTVSASRKKQKITQAGPNIPLNTPSLSMHPQSVPTPMQPSSSAAKRGSAGGGARGKKTKSGGQPLPGVSGMKPMQYPSAGRGQVASWASSGAVAANEPAEPAPYDPLVGQKVWTRWPEDNNFYEAIITQYDPAKGHALVYDINSADETWEWVNLKEISPEDIRWENDDPGVSRRGGRVGQGRGVKKPSSRGGAVPGAGRGRGGPKGGQFKKDYITSENGIGKKSSDDIEILHTDTVLKEVERVFNASHPDPHEIEKTKRMLKEHEQSLIDAIARLADASDGESDEGEHPFSHGQSMDQDQVWRNGPYGGGGSDGDPMGGREGRIAASAYDQRDGDDAQ